MKYQVPKGTRDIVGEEFYRQKQIAETILKVTESYGFRQVQTPMIESMDLLAKDAGEEVRGQIYQVTDKAGRVLGLKSDITPALTRIIANSSKDMPKPIKLSCCDRVYRYERPQKGRYREINQVNAEAYGAPTGLADAQLLNCFYDCYAKLGLTKTEIQLGFRPLLENFIKSLGVTENEILPIIRLIDKKDKITSSEFKQRLINCGLSKQNIKKVQEFILLSGEPLATLKRAKTLFKLQPQLTKYLAEIKNILEFTNNKNIKINLGLARGSEYYTGIIFEARFLSEENWSIGGGGRYDNLISQYSNFSLPAVGFSIGIDRVNLLLQSKQKTKTVSPQIDYFLACKNNQKSRKKTLALAKKLRSQGKNVEIDLLNKNLSDQIEYAKKINAKNIKII